MSAEQQTFRFAAVEGRKVEARFDGGEITTNAGALLLKQVDAQINLSSRVAEAFADWRLPEAVEHGLPNLVGQRIFGLALGYEDLNDHDQLRNDLALQVAVGKTSARREDCAPLASKSTLNRLELSSEVVSRYCKTPHDPAKFESLFVDVFMEAHKRAPKKITLDLDATDDRLHGEQEGRFFHGHYQCYCYLPLLIFAGKHLLAAKLRPANVDAAHGALEEIARIVGQIRTRWPRVRIIVRGDGGFCRNDLMQWCEDNSVHYLFGLAKNSRLNAMVGRQLLSAAKEHALTGETTRRFVDFSYQTRDTWTCRRRVVAKAEWIKPSAIELLESSDLDGQKPKKRRAPFLVGGVDLNALQGSANPRFVVTSLSRREYGARELYEDMYCARGEMENRIKECQLDLFSDRTSTHYISSNQLRLWFSALAYVLIDAVRRIALEGTRLASSTCGSIRSKLFKIGAKVTISVRRIKFSMDEAFPHADVFAAAWAALS